MKCLESDIQRVIEDRIFSENRGGTYLITGATGFLGYYCIRILMEYKRKFLKPVKVIASVRNKSKGEKLFGDYIQGSGFILTEDDIINEYNFDGHKIDYIIHTAGPTHKDKFESEPVSTIEAIVMGTRNILELARKNKVKKILLFSTAQIYGNTSGNYIEEHNVSGFDCMNYRNCYSESKRLAETLGAGYYKQYGTDISVVRLFHVYGPGNSLELGTFFTEFFTSILRGQSILLKSSGAEIRNLCYITDVMLGIFYVLYSGKPGEAYNIGSDTENISIRDFAYLLAEISRDKRISVIEKEEEQQKNNILLQKPSMERLRELGWRSEVSLKEGLDKMFSFYCEMQEQRTDWLQ